MSAAIRNNAFASLLLISGLGLAAVNWWQSPSVGQTVDSTKQSAAVLGDQVRLVTWQTSYFSSRIPATLELKSSTENGAGPINGSYLLSSTAKGRSNQVAVTYGRLGNGPLREISGVHLRLNAPEVYTPTTKTGLPAGALVFTKTDSYETAVFWQHADHYVAVVASGSADGEADMNQALTSLITNLQWR